MSTVKILKCFGIIVTGKRRGCSPLLCYDALNRPLLLNVSMWVLTSIKKGILAMGKLVQ